MDKKVKKRMHVLQQRIQTLQQQLAGVRKQMDDPGEAKSIEQQLAAAESELAKFKDA
jgi:DNA-binding FrmR family transcriptional regulator